MSHNIKLSGVKIRDLDVLATVAMEISGGKAVLDKSATKFRTYHGQPNQCQAAIVLPGKHDVGLIRNNDGSYSPMFDPYTMDTCLRGAFATNHIGGLLQEYALREAEYEAAQRGMSSQRIEGEKGMVTLELVAAN